MRENQNNGKYYLHLLHRSTLIHCSHDFVGLMLIWNVRSSNTKYSCDDGQFFLDFFLSNFLFCLFLREGRKSYLKQLI